MSCCAVAALCGGGASAREEPLRFVHALQRSGYGDMAVEYLNLLAKRPDLPPEIREVWDLEMSKSLKAAAADAFDARDHERLLDQSQKYLAKFLKEKPGHAATANALAEWGDFLLKQAQELIHAANAFEGKNAAEQQKMLTEARTDLANAQEKFQQAASRFEARVKQLSPRTRPSSRKPERVEVVEARQEAETALRDAEFQLAWIDYCTAQAYPAKGPERAAALQKAGKAFDDIFQQNRSGGGQTVGLYAHLWHGKAAEELGDNQLAIDIYDEVLASAPDPAERTAATGLEPLFAQTQYFRLLLVAKQNPQQFLTEAKTWLEQYRRLRQTDGYQGVALELAKAKLAAANKATGPEKVRRASEAMQILIEMEKVHSQYQRDAILLRLDVLKAAGRSDADVHTFEEAVALADAATAASQWDRARDACLKALEIARQQKRNDAEGIKTVQEALARARYNLACDLFQKGKLSECIDAVGAIVFADPQKKTVRMNSGTAAEAASLAVAAALNLYVHAPAEEKPAALAKLTSVAEFTEKNWPDRPEADDARMARAQAKLVVGQVREAIDIFERVNPKSDRYPLAMYRAGQDYAALYGMEKRKPEKDRNRKQMAADRGKAIQRLQTALAILGKAVEPGGPLPEHFAEAQLLLAEIRAEGGEMREAAALYRPLVDAAKATKPKTLDETTLRVFLGAARAHSAIGEIDQAAEVSGLLLELGPDTPQVDSVLTQFARLLDFERKKAVAAVTELQSDATKTAECDAAKKRLASLETLLGTFLAKLAKRQELSLAAMVFIGDTLSAVGMTDEASREYQKIIERDKTDPAFAKAAAGAISRIRAQSIGLLRKQGNFEEALKQVDALIHDYPHNLEPLMEKGYILEGLAEKEPARYDESVSHWVMLRTKLQALRPKPPEYYEVMYRVAACLVREAEKSNDKAVVLDKARKAEQVLKAALVLSPKLNGPDTVARYRVLLDRAIVLQGRQPERREETP
jgi:tetratricopeptide (TPR) repeat protein